MIRSQDAPADILIVDDTPANLEVLSTMLTRHGYRVRPAPSGPLALQSAQLVPPDLILLDILMPGMDGYQVCEQLKEMESTRDVPVIFISALDDIGDKVKAFQAGGVDYITKPFQFREVIARVENHLTLDRLHRQVQILGRLNQQMIQMLSQDLVVPLEDLHQWMESLRSPEGLSLTPEPNSHLETALATTGRMHQQITGLLKLARIESEFNLVLKPISLTELLMAPMQSARRWAEQKQIDWQVQSLPQIEVAVDSDRIVQALDQVFANAIQFTPAGGRVIVSARHTSRQVILTVQDTGIGIPTSDLTRIFDWFYRGADDAHLTVEGIGLGLAIVKTVVRQHRGQVWVESEAGQGTTVHIALPLK